MVCDGVDTFCANVPVEAFDSAVVDVFLFSTHEGVLIVCASVGLQKLAETHVEDFRVDDLVEAFYSVSLQEALL